MWKETIEYVDFDGNKRKEDFYFNFTKAELMEMQMSEDGGLDKYINTIVSSQDGKKILSMFKEIVIKAYGVKSADGRRFIKNDEVRAEFVETEAYSELFTKLAMDDKAASAFVNGVVPKIDNGSIPANK